MLTTQDGDGVTFDKEAPQWDLKEFVPVEVRPCSRPFAAANTMFDAQAGPLGVC